MKIITVIQARLSSSRLPGKVLLPILEKPLLSRMIERVEKSKYIGKVVVATSTNQEDDKIEELCKSENITCFRGHLTDLLDRHYQAALKYDADAVVKIPSDCPLIDPEIIDLVIKYYMEKLKDYDYVSNLHPPTYPDGNDVEIMSIAALRKAWQESTKYYEREHTTPYFWENPQKFRIGNVLWSKGVDYSTTHRWTIDYEEDYQFIKRVFEELYPNNQMFGINDILNLVLKNSEVYDINKKHLGKFWFSQ
ncbi:MAG: acylneuraminate cytidylyltransferase [Ignavibacteria bacterium]|nr:acylneuraminate cytidylyltransferase [Ignavibacteria bacterium]